MHFMIALLLSILSIYSRAAFTDSPFELKYTEPQERTCSTCEQVCVVGFLARNCTNVAGNQTVRLEDTGGFLRPMFEPNNQDVQIKSLRYFGSTVATKCNPIEFIFYDEQDRIARVTYFTPGHSSNECVDFYDATIIGYDGATRLVPVLESGAFKSRTTISSSTTSSIRVLKSSPLTSITTHLSANITYSLATPMPSSG